MLEVGQEVIQLCLTDFSTFPAKLLERRGELALQNFPKVRQFDDFTLFSNSFKGIPVLPLPSRQGDEEALGDTAGPTDTPADVESLELNTNDYTWDFLPPRPYVPTFEAVKRKMC